MFDCGLIIATIVSSTSSGIFFWFSIWIPRPPTPQQNSISNKAHTTLTECLKMWISVISTIPWLTMSSPVLANTHNVKIPVPWTMSTFDMTPKFSPNINSATASQLFSKLRTSLSVRWVVFAPCDLLLSWYQFFQLWWSPTALGAGSEKTALSITSRIPTFSLRQKHFQHRQTRYQYQTASNQQT